MQGTESVLQDGKEQRSVQPTSWVRVKGAGTIPRASAGHVLEAQLKTGKSQTMKASSDGQSRFLLLCVCLGGHIDQVRRGPSYFCFCDSLAALAGDSACLLQIAGPRRRRLPSEPKVLERARVFSLRPASCRSFPRGAHGDAGPGTYENARTHVSGARGGSVNQSIKGCG